MAQPGGPRVSYLRAYREVIPSPSLIEFRARARTIGKQIFGVNSAFWIDMRDTVPVTEESPKMMAEFEGAVEPNITVFSVDSLRVNLFERRALASPEVDDALVKAYTRIKRPHVIAGRAKRTVTGKRIPNFRSNDLPQELNDVEQVALGDAKTPLVIAKTIVESTKDIYAAQGREYSLLLSTGLPAAEIVTAQSKLIDTRLRKMVACQPLFGSLFEGQSDEVLAVPFAYVPGGTPAEHQRFFNRLSSDADISCTLVPNVRWSVTTSD